jgi:hypothetical protein
MPAKAADTRSMSNRPLDNDHLQPRFQSLDAFLCTYQHLWKPRPFSTATLPWEEQHPELADWLRKQSLAHADSQHHQPSMLMNAPAPYPQLAAVATSLSAVGVLPQHRARPFNPRLAIGMPGRKWQQICAFSASLSFQHTPNHWLDWCAGKGHLGRLLSADGQQLTCLERDPTLVANGQALSRRHAITARHIVQDVLHDSATEQLRNEHSPVALHACGDLHVRLMELACVTGCQHLAIAPCCYNRTSNSTHQPLSDAASAAKLKLSLEDLALPLSETVTAGARIRQQRDQSMAWRLAFDLLQRELRGIDEYLPTPSLPPDWLKKDFARYCRDLAELKQLPRVQPRNWSALQAAGWKRLSEVRNLELLRGLFRRPLELWLVLDRALYLQERGYQVRLGRFCNSQLTPRNLLLLAERD